MKPGTKVRLHESMGVRTERGANVRDGIIDTIDGLDVYVLLPGLKGLDGKSLIVHRYTNEMEVYR